jgi:H+-translocating NAD(P) transhydrogenase subunit alpha
MRIAVPKERRAGERRVALVPSAAHRLIAKGFSVVVETGAGAGAFVSDDDYRAAGATIALSMDALLTTADVVVKIHPPTDAEIEHLQPGAILIGLLDPSRNVDLLRVLAVRKVTAMAVDAIPRTTIAQAMDVLSSQSTAAGYRAVILAAEALPRFFPMLVTAAETIPPARVLILGAGVAGLQAIATARRLGAVVEAFDVRAAVKEEVESLGARFVGVDTAEDVGGTGAYARELSEPSQQRVLKIINQRLAQADVCITTALVPGRPAPRLITDEMVGHMKSGSVIVDLAAGQGGNCEATQPGETILRHGVTIIGPANAAGDLAVHASQMYSRNMEQLLLHLVGEGSSGALDGKPTLDFKDAIVQGSVVTHDGSVLWTESEEHQAAPAH